MPKIELQSDSDAFESLARDVVTMYINRSGNNYVQSVGNDFINTVGFAMHLRPDEEKIKEGNSSDSVFFSQEVIDGIQHVIDSIKDYGGNDPYMIIYPVVLKMEKPNKLFDNILSLPLFRVRNKNDAKESKYVDTCGRTYSGTDDFISNAQFPKCEIWYPTNLIFAHDSNGKAQISHTTISPSNMQYVDIAVSVLCLGAGALAMFTGIGIPFAVAITAGCAGYGFERSVETLVDRAKHGQTINPFADWDAFNAWAGIAANAIGFGFAGNAIRLSANMAEMAAEGLRIAETTELALRASIYIPQAINGGLMAVQFYQLVKYWNQIPIEHKIIIGLQFIFFAAASYKMGIISVSNIEEKVTKISYNELREELVRQVDNSADASVLRSNLEAATNRVGGVSIRAIKFFKKLVNYKSGELITAGVNENNTNYMTLTEEGDEIGFQIRNKYFACAEAAMDIHDGVNSDPDQPSSSRSLDTHFRLPEGDGSQIDAVSRLAESKRFVPKESIQTAKDWLKNLLGVNELEDYQVNGVNIFKNMKYHEQMRVRVFEDIGKSLNDSLNRACIRFAEEGNAKTVGQYASNYESAHQQILNEINELALNFEGKTPEEIRNLYQIDVQITTETALTYEDLAQEKPSTMFVDELKGKKLTAQEAISISNIGTDNAVQIFDNWKAQSETSLVKKTIANPEADVHTLANEIVNAGDISYPNSSYHALNAARMIRHYRNPKLETFATDMANDANNTIQSCRGNVESRVFEVTRQKEKLPLRRLIFWNLDDQEYGKSTIVTVNKETGDINIQNFVLKKIITTAIKDRNHKTAIIEHWNNNFNYDAFKTRLTTVINTIKEQCKAYVGHAVVRAGLDHDSTVSDIQSLKSVRFGNVEQAVHHVLKHAENLTSDGLVAATKNYFDKSQEVIQYSRTHPGKVSSTWSQTGSARDFTFYRQLEGQTGVEKVVVLVREGGEVILKTYYNEKFGSIPPQEKHQFREPVDIKHASLLTFYFQLMLLAPRYGVLLPKDYELYNTEMDAKKSHTIIIMAGHYFEDSDNPNTQGLADALKHAFPINDISWNVVAIKVGSIYAFDIYDYKGNYLYCRIKTYRFLIFAPPISSDKTVKIVGDKHKYSGYAKQGTVRKNIGFNDETLDLANRICSHTTKVKKITRALKEVFGGCWSCIRLSYYFYDLSLNDVYLSLNFNGTDITCCIFRC